MTSLLTAATSWSAARPGDERAVWAHRVVFDGHDGLAALRELRLGVGGGDHDDVRRAGAQLLAGRCHVGRDPDNFHPVRGQPCVGSGLVREARAGRDHELGAQGRLAEVAEAEQAEDQHGAGHDADERARAAEDLDRLLAGDGQDAEWASGEVHRTATSSGALGHGLGQGLGEGLGQGRFRVAIGVVPAGLGNGRSATRGTPSTGPSIAPSAASVASVRTDASAHVIPGSLGPADQQREHLVERRPGLVDRGHRGALGLDARHHRGGDRRGVRAEDLQPPRREPPDVLDADVGAEAVDVDRVGRLDLEQLAAEREVAQRLRRVERDQPPLGDQGDHVALLGLGHVLGGDQERAAGLAQPVELAPDALADERVDAGGRLVEEHQLGVVDERAGELQPAAHAARQVAGPSLPGVGELQPVEQRPDARPPLEQEQPVQARDEVQVLADGQVVVQRDVLGHEADPGAGLGGKPGGVGAEHLGLAAGRAEGAREQPDRRRLAGAAGADDADDRPARDREVDARQRDDVVEGAAGAAQGGDGRGDLGRRLTGHRRSLGVGPLQA